MKTKKIFSIFLITIFLLTLSSCKLEDGLIYLLKITNANHQDAQIEPIPITIDTDETLLAMTEVIPWINDLNDVKSITVKVGGAGLPPGSLRTTYQTNDTNKINRFIDALKNQTAKVSNHFGSWAGGPYYNIIIDDNRFNYYYGMNTISGEARFTIPSYQDFENITYTIGPTSYAKLFTPSGTSDFEIPEISYTKTDLVFEDSDYQIEVVYNTYILAKDNYNYFRISGSNTWYYSMIPLLFEVKIIPELELE